MTDKNQKVRIVVTARAIIFNDKKELLLVKNNDSKFWFAPGGWLDGFEKLEEACVREVYEELGITVKPIKLLKIDYYQITAKENLKWKENVNKIEHYFLCDITKGNIKSNDKNRNLWQDEDAGHTQFVKFFSSNDIKNSEVVPLWLKSLF